MTLSLRPSAGLARSISLVACILSVAAARPAAGAVPAHLYIEFTRCPPVVDDCIARYPLSHVPPVFRPDLIYRHVMSPMAVGPDGTFYAADTCCPYPFSQIDAFAPGSTVVTRSVTLPHIIWDGTTATALAVGGDGYLYVGYIPWLSGLGVHARVERRHRLPATGVAVYAPDADGGRPLMAFDASGDGGVPLALAVSGNGDLLTETTKSGKLSFVYTTGDPHGHPTTIGRLDLPAGQFGLALALSPAGDLYVPTRIGRGGTSQVLVYPSGARGKTPPARTIDLPRNTFGIGLYAATAYSLLVAQNGVTKRISVLAYPAASTGRPPWIAQRDLAESQIGIGPLMIGP